MNSPVLLCVANQATILTRLKIELEAGFGKNIAIEIAETGTKAFTVFSEILEEGREVAVVIADYNMSGMKGDKLLTQMHQRSPQTMTILLTEPEDLGGVVEGIHSANLYRYLCKPWQSLDLQLTVKEALRRYHQEQDLTQKTAQLDKVKQDLKQARIEQAVLIAKLQEHNYRHKQFIDAVPIGILVSDSQGKPCYVNQAGAQILGRGLVEFVDADQFIETYQVYQAGTDRLYPADRHPLVQALHGKQGWVEDMEICHSDRRIPVESWGTPIYDRQGHLTHAIAVFMDITERQQAQRILANANQQLAQQVAERTAELQDSQARNQALLTAIPDMIFCSQADGTYIDFKPSPTIPTVVPPDVFLGKKPEEIFPPELAQKIQAAYQESLVSGEVQHLEYQLRIDNQLRDYEARIVPCCHQEIITIVRDISDRKQAEAQIAFQASLLDQVHNAVIATDLAGTIIYTNQFARDLYQLDPETIIGQSIFNVTVLPNDQTLAQEILATVQDNGYWEGEFIVQRQEGSTFPIYATNTLIQDDQGNPIGYVGVSIDISIQKQVEEELRRSEQLYRTMAKHFPNGSIFLFDHNLRYLVADGQSLGSSGSGYSRTVLEGKTIWEALSHQECAVVEPLYREALTGIEKSLEMSYRNRIHLLQTRAVRNEAGDIIAGMVVVQDITERKQVEESLREREAFLRSIYEGIEAAVFIVDVLDNGEFRYVSINPTHERMSGLRCSELTGKTPAEALTPDLAEIVSERYQVCVAAGERITYEECLPIKGKETWWITNLTPLRESNGRIYQLIGTSFNISDRKQVEKTLQLQAAAMSAASDGIAILNQAGDYVYLNQAHAHIFGYDSPAQLLGQNWQMLYEVAEYQRLLEECVPLLLQQGYCRTEAQGLRRDGSTFPHDVSVTLLPGGERICIVRDSRERKQAEIALRESQHFVQRIAEASPNLLYIFDLTEQRNVYTNRELATFLGYTMEQIQAMGENVLPTLIHPEDLARLSPYLQQLTHAVDGEIFEIEYRVRDAQGKWHTLLARETPFARDTDGNVTQLLGTATDITERKQIEAALKESERRYELATRAAKVGVWEWNLDTNDCYIDPIIKATLGYEETEFTNHFNQWITAIHPDDQSIFLTATQAHLAGETSEYRIEHRMIHKDGSIRWIVVRGQAIRDAQGNRIRMVGTHTDITPRKFAEIALQEAKEAADAANQAKSIFLANMSHELRSPLNAILGFAQLMSYSDRLPPDYQNNLRIIHHSGEHLLTLINQVLDLSKIEAGRITLNPTAFNLNHLLREVEEMFHLKATEKGIELQFQCGAEVPPSIKTDEIKLRQVLINLISNAVKFTSAGMITVQITRQQVTEDNCITLQFEIKDTGCGIAADELETIFEPFVQSQSGIQSQNGTGLGLAITRKFIQLMDGEITVKSQLRQGTTFTFTIQAQLTDDLSSTNPNRFGRVIALTPNQPHYRILIVDDQRENRQLLWQLLNPVGFELQEASNGEEAIEIWHHWQPHLILMDLRMPGMNGYAVTQQIRQRCRDLECHLSTSPIIIALSASVIEEERLKALEVGCTDFITKPFHESDLFAAIGQHLGISFIYDEPSEPSMSMETISLTSEDVAILPTDWLSSFHQATLEGDFEVMLSLIEQIQDQDKTLAQRLSYLAHNFEFEQLLDATESWVCGDI